jgi:hypothetical protein
MSPWENLSLGAQRTGLVEGRRCHGAGGRVLFKLRRNGCRVFFRVGRRVLFRVGRRVLFRIVRSPSLRVVRRVLFLNGRKMLFMSGRRERAGLVLVLYQGVYCIHWDGRKVSSAVFAKRALGPGRGEEDGRIQVIWQREYGKRRLRHCTVLYKTGRKDCNSQRSTRCKELEGKCMTDFNSHCYPFHVRLVLNLALGTHVEAKMFTFNLECTHVIFNKCPI